ncbi:MAG: Na(+)/H(+) antiporter subunit D [Hyphomonadaceae bacterium]|nr:Na(+)/H(+) antiporter subunit D [Hyphomonadaceae bacterium]
MMAFLETLNPGFVLVLAGVVGCLIPARRVRQGLMVAAPLIGIFMLSQANQSMDLATAELLGLDLVLYRVDSLNFIFGLAFLIAAFLNAIYALHSDDQLQDGMAMAYAGAAVAAAFAGDLLTLFVFWELTAVSSVFLILRAGTRAAYFASMRYLAIQILSGVLLLAGITYVYQANGEVTLAAFTSLDDPGAMLIFFAVGIKAAFPFLHNWLQDSYPKATVVGAVVLSAFTTKLAVLTCARLFPGFEILIWIGAVMTIFPVFFAVIENDLRKVLAYSLNNQVGFMICAIGVGTPLALNGAAAHAFAHIMYKALLFMSMGAVLYRTGTTKANELGGLYKSMPLTTVFCLIGAASISAFPLFSGFVAKSLTMSAVAYEGYVVAWLMLLFASAGVLEHSGIKIPYFAFFGHDSGKRVKEAPFNMLLAMGLASAICILIGLPSFFGLGYGWLYDLLPYPDVANHYQPFTLDHILTQMQLLMLAILAFILLKRFGLYPPEKPGTILDADWTYRRLGFGFANWAGTVWGKAGPAMTHIAGLLAGRGYDRIEAAFSPRGQLSRGPLTGGMAIWAAALLGMAMLLSFLTVQ